MRGTRASPPRMSFALLNSSFFSLVRGGSEGKRLFLLFFITYFFHFHLTVEVTSYEIVPFAGCATDRGCFPRSFSLGRRSLLLVARLNSSPTTDGTVRRERRRRQGVLRMCSQIVFITKRLFASDSYTVWARSVPNKYL